MKTILAPIDFSDASTNALAFAAELAKRASANLIVVNILPKGGDEATAKSKLKSTEVELKKTYGPKFNFKSLVVQGTLITELNKIIKDKKPNLIVMGTKGATGLKRILIGSNTVNLLAKTKVPVLVIPEVARFESFLKKGKNRVVLATDLNELKNEDSLDTLKKIALMIIKPKVRVVSVRPKGTRLDFLKDMERSALLSAFRPEIESDRATVFSSSVMKGINFYLNEHKDTGLLAMIARDSGQLIQKHYTREMASNTHLPLLVLHDAKN
jgi:nucleotide-binding universal stress UspA family protein